MPRRCVCVWKMCVIRITRILYLYSQADIIFGNICVYPFCKFCTRTVSIVLNIVMCQIANVDHSGWHCVLNRCFANELMCSLD